MALESLPVQHPIVCVGPASDSRISDLAVVQFLAFVLGMAMAPRFAAMMVLACRPHGGVAALATGALRRMGR
jgi:hypothetical protein